MTDSVLITGTRGPKFNTISPFKNRRRNASFKSLVNAGLDSGLNVFLSRFDQLDLKRKIVSNAWTLNGDWRRIRNKKIKLVFYRGKNILSKKIGTKLNDSNITMINHPELENICDDKLLTPFLFPEIMQKSYLINNHYELLKVLKLITTNKIVLKPRFGSFGKDVIVIEKSKLRNGIVKDTIIQEFIDSTKGARSLGIKGAHDIRVISINGKIDHCYVRTPPNGSLVANMANGGSKFYVDSEDLPSSIQKNLSIIDRKLSDYTPRIYSADFIINEDKEAKLIELNSKPGTMFYENSVEIREKFHKNILKAIKKAL